DVNGSYGSIMDVNGDGFADLGVGADRATTAVVFPGGATGLPPTPATTLMGGTRFGSISSAGDVNGDGFGDVVVGAYGVSAAAGRPRVSPLPLRRPPARAVSSGTRSPSLPISTATASPTSSSRRGTRPRARARRSCFGVTPLGSTRRPSRYSPPWTRLLRWPA